MIYYNFLEIRNRSILLLVTWVSVLSFCYYYKEILLFLCLYFSLIQKNHEIFYFIFTDVKEIFSVYIKLIFFFSNQIFLFFFVLHIFSFLSLGLYVFEFKIFKFALMLSFFSWFFSIVILNKLILPVCFNFFLSFQSLSIIDLHFEAKLVEYLNFYISIYFFCLFYCQLIVAVIVVFEYSNNDFYAIKTYRKIFYLFFLFFSTAITPPDIFSQLLFFFLLIVIFEFFVLLNFIKITFFNLVTN